MSLRAKFVAMLALTITLGVGTTGTILILRHSRHDRALLAEKQLLLVEHSAFALKENLSVAARELSRLSQLKEIDPADNDIDPERMLLYSAHENSVFFKQMRILDPDGKVTLVQPAGAEGAGQSFADRRWFEDARRARQPFFYSSPERALAPDAIAVVVPIRHDGRFAGAIQGILDLHDDAVLTPELRHTAGPYGEFLVADRDGHILFLSAAPRAAAGDAAAGNSPDASWNTALQELALAHAGSRHVASEMGDFMYAYAPVGIGSWGVAMRWPWAVLNADTASQVFTTGAILVVGMLVAGLFGVFFAAYLIRPLLELSAIASRLARGETGGAVASRRGDEIGALFNAFHHMEQELASRDQKIREDLETISRLNTSLEERVSDRTRELEQAQARLLDAERFAAMGKTAAAIAHEVRNALNGLGMCVDLVLADTARARAGADNAPAGGSMRVRAQIHSEIARLRDVTESLLTFSRTPRLELAAADVNALVGRALEVLSEQIADGGVIVETHLDGGGAPLIAACDGPKLQGVLINLIKNAVESMATRPLDLDAPELPETARELRMEITTRRVGIAEGGGAASIEVEVEDTGPGMSTEARRRLFEPFFTTKVTGTGLGLATARRIIEAHGGELEVMDVPDGGARSRIRFPAT